MLLKILINTIEITKKLVYIVPLESFSNRFAVKTSRRSRSSFAVSRLLLIMALNTGPISVSRIIASSESSVSSPTSCTPKTDGSSKRKRCEDDSQSSSSYAEETMSGEDDQATNRKGALSVLQTI
ncbi:hypothetical protein EUTSA_v10019772mg, partial [Eutrema salsugineum]